MPRQRRVEYAGAVYHVMCRGDRGEDIFLDDVDRHDFIKTLAEASQKTGWQVHAFCLMRNHYHLVLETPNANPVAGMAWLQSRYTIRLNHRHKLLGFEGGTAAARVAGSGFGRAAQERSGQAGLGGAAAAGNDAFTQGDRGAGALGQFEEREHAAARMDAARQRSERQKKEGLMEQNAPSYG